MGITIFKHSHLVRYSVGYTVWYHVLYLCWCVTLKLISNPISNNIPPPMIISNTIIPQVSTWCGVWLSEIYWVIHLSNRTAVYTPPTFWECPEALLGPTIPQLGGTIPTTGNNVTSPLYNTCVQYTWRGKNHKISNSKTNLNIYKCFNKIMQRFHILYFKCYCNQNRSIIVILNHYLIETPFNAFANRADPD